MSSIDYIKRILKKDINSLTLKDLEDFFKDEQEETNILEFKSGKVEINDVYKEVAAFLNTEGGILIIGSPEEKEISRGKHKKCICKGQLTFSRFRGKNWLLQKIMSNISPPPVDIKGFEHIDNKGSLIVLNVPQSTTPPHQCCGDGKYYIRLDSEARPAPHGIVQALFNKRKKPILEAAVHYSPKKEKLDEVEVRLYNRSNIPAEKIGIHIEVYNAVEICSNTYSVVPSKVDDLLGERYTISEELRPVLVRPLHFSFYLDVTHRNVPYMITVGYWSRDNEYDFQFWVYDPLTQLIVSEGRMDSSEVDFWEELKKIQ